MTENFLRGAGGYPAGTKPAELMRQPPGGPAPGARSPHLRGVAIDVPPLNPQLLWRHAWDRPLVGPSLVGEVARDFGEAVWTDRVSFGLEVFARLLRRAYAWGAWPPS